MILALIFRGNAHWTTGYAFGRALTHLGVEHAHVDNNDIWNGKVSLKDFDAAICVDDGFALKSRILPNMPKLSAYFAIDVHGEPDAYLPYLHQFGIVYCAQKTYGVDLAREYGLQARWLPLAWDSIGVPYKRCWKSKQDIPFGNQYRPTEISMIASWSTEQRILWREIINHKYVGIAKEAYGQKMGETYSSSKLGLNILGGSGHKTYYNHINQRVWEMMGCGALVLHQDPADPLASERIPDYEMAGFVGAQAWFRNADATHHFWDRKPLQGNENLVFWKDASQLLYTIDYYLNPDNEQERIEIAKRGQEWVAENHTYVHRCQKILDDLGVRYD